MESDLGLASLCISCRSRYGEFLGPQIYVLYIWRMLVAWCFASTCTLKWLLCKAHRVETPSAFVTYLIRPFWYGSCTATRYWEIMSQTVSISYPGGGSESSTPPTVRSCPGCVNGSRLALMYSFNLSLNLSSWLGCVKNTPELIFCAFEEIYIKWCLYIGSFFMLILEGAHVAT